MIKYALLISSLVIFVAESQRPPYAGSPGRYPQVLPRFQDQTSTTTVNPPGLANRVGEEAASGNGPAAKPESEQSTSSTTSTTPSPLPLDELGFGYAVQQVQNLPENQQPWWYINRHQIAQHLNPVGGTSQDTINRQKPVETRSFFSG